MPNDAGDRPAARTDVAVGNPLLTGPLQMDGDLTVGLAQPVPPIRDIPAGFDAIFQFRSDFLGDRLAQSVQQTLGQLYTVIEYDATGLKEEVRDEINRRISMALAGPASTSLQIGGASGSSPPVMVDIDRYVLQVTVHSPRITLLLVPQDGFDTGVRWVVDLHVLIPEAGPPSTGVPSTPGIGLGSTPLLRQAIVPGQTPLVPGGSTQTIFLTRGRADTRAIAGLNIEAALFQVSAWLNFAGTAVALRNSGDTLFGEMANQQLQSAAEAAIAPLLSASSMAITPRMSPGGALRANEQLPGLQPLRAVRVTTLGNASHSEVLSIGVNVGPAAEAGDPDLIRPFVRSENFAYYVSETVIRTVVKSRWARPDTPRTLHVTLPVELADEANPDVLRTGHADIRLTFPDALLGADLDVSPGHPNVILISGFYEIRLIELRDHTGQVVGDLGELGDPATEPFMFDIFSFGGSLVIPGAHPVVRDFLAGICWSLLDPIYRPCIERISHTAVRGRISDALGAIILRGHMA